MKMKEQVTVVIAQITGLRKNGIFGFATVEEKEVFYFNLRDQRYVEAGPSSPEFTTERKMNLPKIGDRIYLVKNKENAKEGQKPAARVWCQETAWNLAEAECRRRMKSTKAPVQVTPVQKVSDPAALTQKKPQQTPATKAAQKPRQDNRHHGKPKNNEAYRNTWRRNTDQYWDSVYGTHTGTGKASKQALSSINLLEEIRQID